MTRWRRAVVNVVVLFVLGGHVLSLVLDKEIWPFSPYAMYTRLERGPGHATSVFYGVSEGREWALDVRRQLAPFDPVRLVHALRKLPEGAQEAAARDLARLYERNRQRGRHDGPPLDEVRLYRLYWDVTPENQPRLIPEERRLIMGLKVDGGTP